MLRADYLPHMAQLSIRIVLAYLYTLDHQTPGPCHIYRPSIFLVVFAVSVLTFVVFVVAIGAVAVGADHFLSQYAGYKNSMMICTHLDCMIPSGAEAPKTTPPGSYPNPNSSAVQSLYSAQVEPIDWCNIPVLYSLGSEEIIAEETTEDKLDPRESTSGLLSAGVSMI